MLILFFNKLGKIHYLPYHQNLSGRVVTVNDFVYALQREKLLTTAYRDFLCLECPTTIIVFPEIKWLESRKGT